MKPKYIWLCILLVATGLAATGHAHVARLVNYQGVLTDDEGVPLNGPHDLQFRVYPDSSQGADDIWSERHSGVMFEDGLFNVILGSVVEVSDTVFNENERWLGIVVDSGTELYPRTRLTSVPWALRAGIADSAAAVGAGVDGDWMVSGNDIYMALPGNVGIGTPSPGYNLEVSCENQEGGLQLSWGTEWPTLRSYLGYTAAGGLVINSCSGGGWADIDFQSDGESRLFLESQGNVGIGTVIPLRDLEVYDSAGAYVRVTSDVPSGAVLELKNEYTGISGVHGRLSFLSLSDDVRASIKYSWAFGVPSGLRFDTDGSTRMTITSSGRVGIGTADPDELLHVNGTAQCDVLKINGGSDIAEPFDVRGADMVSPGTVVAIDPADLGKLKVSDRAYDRCVAGIVSGAGDVRPGMIMGQAGTVADGEYPVALTGRVYCRADAYNGSIAPGDLLTTSDIRGHAMKVTDYERAQGAVIGKAMSSLEEGQGLVLVLVTLQ